MTKFYNEYSPTFDSRFDWNSPAVLRKRAEKHPDKIYLEVPWTNESYSYAETLNLAERVGSSLRSSTNCCWRLSSTTKLRDIQIKRGLPLSCEN